MAKSKSQQATNLAKQYTADQLAAAMIYGETRAGVDAKGNMKDPLAGVRELRAADNRAKATGKDLGNILTQPKQFQGLSQQSLKAITNPDSIKNPGDRAAANAALAKAKDYLAGKYEGQVGKGTPYDNITSFNKADEKYNLKKSGAVPGSHIGKTDSVPHSYFTTPQMDKQLQKSRAAEAAAAAKSAASQPGSAPTESINVATPTAVITPQGTNVVAPKGEISAGQSIQGSNVIDRQLGPIGQTEEGSTYDNGSGQRWADYPTSPQSLYKVPPMPLAPLPGGTPNMPIGSGYTYASPNKNLGQGTGQGQGQGTGQGGGSSSGSSGGSSSGSSGAGTGAGASGDLPSGLGDGTIGGGGYGSSGDLPSGLGDGTIGGGGYGDAGASGGQGQIPQGYGADDQSFNGLPDISNDTKGPTAPEIVGQDYGDTGNIPSNLNSQSEPANPTAPYVDWNENGQVDPNTPLTPGAPPPVPEQQAPAPKQEAAPEPPQIPDDYGSQYGPVPGPTDDLIGQLPDLSGVQYASLNTGTMNDASGYIPDYYAPQPPAQDYYTPSYDYASAYDPATQSAIDQSNFNANINTYTPDYGSSSGVDTSSYYTPLDTSYANYSAPSYDYGTSYDIPSYSYDAPSYDFGAPSFDMGAFDAGFAKGGRINSHVAEALKKTNKVSRSSRALRIARGQ